MFNSATPWTVACQVPLSMGFPRQEYWSGLPFRFQGDLSNPGIKHGSHALATDSLPLSHQGSPSLCPQLSSVHFSCSVMSDSLSPHGLQHTRLCRPSPSPRVCSNSHPLCWWMPSNHLILCRPLLLLPSIFPATGSFPMSRLLAPGGQSIGASASASVIPMNSQDWFPLELTGLISLLSKGLSRNFSSSIVWRHQFFGP